MISLCVVSNILALDITWWQYADFADHFPVLILKTMYVYLYLHIYIYTCIHNTVDIRRKQTTFFCLCRGDSTSFFVATCWATAAKWCDEALRLDLFEALGGLSHAPRQCRVADDCINGI